MVRQDSYEDEVEDDGEYIADDDNFDPISISSSSVRPHKAPSGGGGGSAGLLFLLGFAMSGAGLALAFAPKLGWKVNKVNDEIQRLGLEHGSLILGGLVVFCLGMVARTAAKAARAQAPAAPQEEKDSDFMLVADQLATDLAQVLSSLLQMSEEIAALGEGQRSLLAAQEEKSGEQNAIFGLATSVDRLNARVDESLQAFDQDMRSRMEALSRRVVDAQSSMENKLAAMASAAPAPAPAAVPAPAPAPVAPPVSQAPAAPQAAFDIGIEPALPTPATEEVLGEVQETSMQFFENMEKMEDSPSADAPPAALPNDEIVDPLDALLPDDAIRRLREQ